MNHDDETLTEGSVIALDQSPMLTPEQVAALLNISKATLCRLTKRGEIPHKRLGDRIVRYNRDEIENWQVARLAEQNARSLFQAFMDAGPPIRGEAVDEKIYFIQAGDAGPIKIGYTLNSVANRLAGIQTGNHEELRIIGVMPGGRATEAEIHEQIAQHRIRGEWFHPHADVFALLRRLQTEAA
jgi:excisionase family DNA binding protein